MRYDDPCILCGTTRSEAYERSMGMYCPNSESYMHKFGDNMSVMDDLLQIGAGTPDFDVAFQPVKTLEPGAHYVVGFAFDRECNNILLISKRRPDFQTGKLNGVGGRVEDQDRVRAKLELKCDAGQVAMAREWNEEVAGVVTEPLDWHPFCEIADQSGWSVSYYFTNADITNAIQKTDEQVVIIDRRELTIRPVIPNVIWLVYLALTLHPSHPVSNFTDSAGFFHIMEMKRRG